MDRKPLPGQEPFSRRRREARTPTTASQALRRSSLDKTGLNTPDSADIEAPPPAYGDIYGEIHGQDNDLGTSAYVSDDGRVNIRVNQLNRRLSQVFAPALRQQLKGAQDLDTPPPPYVPPSLGGEKGVPPPSLNVVIQVVGSHGDVQPFVALGKVLKDTYHHRVRLATHANFKSFVESNGLEFFNIGGDASQLMAFMVKNPSLMPGFRSIFSGDVSRQRRNVGEYLQGCWRSCYESGDGITDPDDLPDSIARPFVADCIIANPPSFAHIHCAEKMSVPLHIMFTMPYTPTQTFPHPLANIQSSNADRALTNLISYSMVELLSWQGLGDIINRFRKKCLGLDPIGVLSGPGMLHRLKVPHTYCWSPSLIPKPRDWGSHLSIAGFYFLKSANYTPDPDLLAFLESGQPPIYIGFGSIVLEDPGAVTQIIFEGARNTGQRILLSKGWGGIGADHLPEDVFLLDRVPHDWLFQHVSCVVHHGGAGTTAAGIAAGRPTVVVPFFGDQPFWGTMVAKTGAGPEPIPIKKLTAQRLAEAITFCLDPECRDRARELAEKIASEQGADVGAQFFHQHLDPDRLRCTLVPSRPAVWRVKRSKVKLSAFAACTLADAGLLDLRDLRLFRAQEYYPDEGPTDPISGGMFAAMRTLNSLAIGLADIPVETWKASAGTYKALSGTPKRKQSEASLPVSTTERIEGPTPPSLSRPETESMASLHSSKSPELARRPSTISAHSKTSSLLTPSEMSLARSRDSNTARRTSTQTNASSSKNRDMLRPSGPHTSKGLGRLMRTSFQIPGDMAVGMMKGFHNTPKIWGDDTVRPQERVYDLKTGLIATGKDFGLGWYDGFTGLVTQPWNGARKEGAAGFAKGFAKGFGGLVFKPCAGSMGLFAHSMRGLHKEIQKRVSGSDVQSYILASRAAQGQGEWMASSEEERQDVVDRWKKILKYLKKRNVTDDMYREILEEERSTSVVENGEGPSRDAGILDDDDIDSLYGAGEEEFTARRRSTFSEDSIVRPITNGSVESGIDGRDRDAELQQTIDQLVATLRLQRKEYVEHLSDQELLRQAMEASTAETQPVAEGSSRTPNGIPSSSTSHHLIQRKPVPVPLYDPGHLAGISQGEFERKGKQREKTTEERREEKIVLEYVKKQSMLEGKHERRSKGKGRVSEDQDEDLRRALEMSFRESRGRGEQGLGFHG